MNVSVLTTIRSLAIKKPLSLCLIQYCPDLTPELLFQCHVDIFPEYVLGSTWEMLVYSNLDK